MTSPVRDKFVMHRIVLIVVLVLGVSSPVYCRAARAGVKPPNIVLIISDDQAWTDYGFMGHEVIRTPNIDRLASQSLVFPRGYVTASLCRPSLATMITGLYPHQHKITSNDPPLQDDKAEFLRLRQRMIDHIDKAPTLLAEAGYVSFQSGKWWEGHYSRGGFTDGMTHGDPDRGGRHGDRGLRIGRDGLEPIFEFIRDADNRPFFIWYAPFLPHTPHNPPERLLEHYQALTDSPHIARYWAMCEWFDETCGELLRHLDEQNLSDNTIVLYVTDNGWIQKPDAGGYAPRSKRSPFDGGLRTPIMVKWPGHIAPRQDDTPVSSIDLAPTILRAAGLDPDPRMRGVNLLDEQAVDARDAVFGATYAHNAVDINDPSSSLQYRWVVRGRWKLIEPADSANQEDRMLFDLLDDPFERDNLAGDRVRKSNNLLVRLNAWWRP